MTKKKEESVLSIGASSFGVLGIILIFGGIFLMWIVPIFTNVCFIALGSERSYHVSESTAYDLILMVKAGFVWLIAAVIISLIESWRNKLLKGGEEK